MHERVGKVFDFLDELIDMLPVPSSHRALLRIHLATGRDEANVYPELPAIQLPLLVHAAIRGDEQPALPVAGACMLLYLGADLFDNLIDDELPASWHARDPAEASLAATTLLAALPQLALARLRERGTPPARIWDLAHLFAETLLTMSAGEHEDLLLTDQDGMRVETYRVMVERKSGSEFALFAKAGALLATEDADVVDKYAAFGECLGTARQICTDVWDIWKGENSQDLLNGKRTLPIVHALYTLRGESRQRLQDLLKAMRDGANYHGELRKMLLAAGSVHYTDLIVGVYRRRARDYLAAACPREPAGEDLRTLFRGAFLLGTRENTHL
jgi:geranylgeranyl pyrophosphate synthase